MADLAARTAPLPKVTVPASDHTRISTRGYRPELQGLRALAVVFVMIYHIWSDRISGGVDVFFVLSGFLVTGQLLRAAERGGIRFRPLWGRMIKRLFPAALTVLVAVIAASVIWLPEQRWLQTIREVAAAALYLENWQLAADSVDYLGQNNQASVVQHFWSLSIQGQFFVAWPLLIALLALIARGVGMRLRTTTGLVLLVTFVVSLTYSIELTTQNQPLAYFHSLTRVWEFAMGGLLVLVIDRVRLASWARVVLGWLGVTGLVLCGMVLQVATEFPGYVALWPTGCAVLVLVAGASGSRAGADRLLASRPLEYVGNLSYALYLWHWPVLIFYLVARERPDVGLRGGVVVITIAVVLSMLTHHLIEEPARRSGIGERNKWGAYRFGALLLVPVLGTVGTWQVITEDRADYTIATNDTDHPGALALAPGYRYTGAPDAEILPPMAALPNDWATVDGMDCELDTQREVICTTGPADTPNRHLIMVGDSHVRHYLPALRTIAKQRDWRLTLFWRGGCAFSTETYYKRDPQGCSAWNSMVAARVIAEHPDAVFVLGSRNVRAGLAERTPHGFVEMWRRMTAAGIPVAAVRDSPRLERPGPACVTEHGPYAAECATDRATLLASPAPFRLVPDMPQGVSFLDFSDYLCGREQCAPVVGNVLVYRDPHHISTTYMTTMTPFIEDKLLRALGWGRPD